MDVNLLSHAGYPLAFLTGLLGGVHCLGMCGGIVSALTFSLPPTQRNNIQTLLPLLLSYNAGRISGYVLAGALVGGLSALLLQTTDLIQVHTYLQIFAALFMMALGLYLAGIWHGVAKIENAGRILWKYIEPYGRRFIPITSAAKAFPLGFIWGWLPCGLVYTSLFGALASGSALHGALLMLAFGLGTLPNLLLMGAAAAKLAKYTRDPKVKRIAGLSIVALGIFFLWQAIK